MTHVKTLILLLPGFPKSEADTACLPLQQALTRALASLDPFLRVLVIAFHYPHTAQVYSCGGADVKALGGRNRGGAWSFVRRRQARMILQEACEQTQVIGLLSFWHGECAAVGEWLATRTGLPHFCWLMGQDARPHNRYPKVHPLPADRIIALSEALQDTYEKSHGIRPARVITPGIDYSRLEHPASRHVDLLAVGSLIDLKQFDQFLEVVRDLRATHPQLIARLVGEGPCRARLERLLCEWGLETTVVMTGELAYPQVLDCMKRSKILLHTSLYEGFSGVCLEAISAGAHVISFCRPMAVLPPQWQVVASVQEMQIKASMLLESGPTFCSDRSFPIESTARQVLSLFGPLEATEICGQCADLMGERWE
ncbi:MAG: glycosyltransferase [Flaviaesturariibacter sp.]|nr:glycosyltransferase [Flaviaesturariibacter sp.]